MNNLLPDIRGAVLLLLLFLAGAGAMDLPMPPLPLREYPTGWVPLDPAERATLLREFTEIVYRPQRSPLPARWVNSLYLPPVAQGSQGQLGICGSICVTYFLATHQQAKARGWEHPGHDGDWSRVTSPAWGVWMFPHGTKGDIPWGANPYGTIKSVIEHGIRSYQDYPFTGSMDLTWRPSYEDMVPALAWRALSGSRLGGLGADVHIQAAKQVLAGGDILVCAIGQYEDLNDYPNNPLTTSQEVYYRQERNSGGPHALTIVGYDDDKAYIDSRSGERKRGALLLVNSWGANWGVAVPEVEGGAGKGLIWVAYEAAGLLFDVCTMSFPEDEREITLVARSALHNLGDTWIMSGFGSTFGRWFDHVSLRFANRNSRLNLFSDYNAGDLDEQDYLYIPMDVSELAGLRFPNLRLQATAFGKTPEGEVSLTFHPFPLPHDTPLPPEDAPLPVYDATGYLRNSVDLSMMAPKTLDWGLTPSSGSASQADVNGDGRADMVISFRQGGVGGAWGDQRTWLCLNDGAGGFAVTDLGLNVVGEVAWGDVDNDGHLDVIHSGQRGQRPATILLNDGAGNFTQSPIQLPAGHLGGMAVADLDRDGRLDIILLNDSEGVLIMHQQADGSFAKLVTGFAVAKSLFESAFAIDCGDVNGDGLPDFVFTGLSESTSSYEARIRVAINQGNLQFALRSTETPGLQGASLALGDYDSDGRDDLAWSGGVGNRGVFGIMRALADGSFKAADLSPDIAPVYRGRAAWVDLDHDGHRELVIGGRELDASSNPGTYGWYGDPTKVDLEGYYSNHTRILAHQGDNTFVEAGLRLPGTMGDNAPSLLACLDLDGDGDLDIFTAGCAGSAREWSSSPGGAPAATTRSRTFTNRLEDIFSQRRPNLPPTAPTTLAATVAGGAATFTWSGATDNATPEGGLRYILAVGTTPGGNDVASGAVAPQMSGLLVRSGVTLGNLPVGTLYWRVRTVDASLARSPWSAERTLVVGPYAPTGQVELSATIGGTVNPPPGRYARRHGETFAATAIRTFGYAFVDWTVDGQSVPGNPLNLMVGANHQVTANFAASTATLSSPDWIRHPVSGTSFPWHEWGTKGHVVLAFGNYLYCFPGWGKNSTDAWRSSNGDNWNYETFPPTDSVFFTDAFGVVFNNRIWFMGGRNTESQAFNHVWSASANTSSGRLTWRQEPDAPWGGRSDAGCAVFADKLWVVSGSDANRVPYGDVWFTADGINWTQGADVPWMPRRENKLVAADGWLYAMTGQGSVSPAAPPEVWRTADGETWEQLCASAPWFGFNWHFSAAFFDNRLHVTSGPDLHWISQDDGVTWVQVRPNADSLVHWDDIYSAELVVFMNRLWLVGDDDNWSLPADASGLKQVTLTLAVSGYSFNGCTTSPPPGQYVDLADTDFPIAALPGPGYAFVGWGDSPEMSIWRPSPAVADSAAAVTTVNLATATNLVAIFTYVGELPPVGTPVPLAASVYPPGAGTLVVPAQVPLGSTETIRANAAAGYEFSHWRGSAVVSPLLAQSAIVADSAAGVAVVACFRPIGGDLHASARNSMLRCADGSVWIWGDRSRHLLGPHWQPAQGGLPAFAALTGINQIALANDAAFARQGAKVWKWGAFSYPNQHDPASPIPRPLGNKVFYSGTGYVLENSIAQLLAGGGATAAATISQAGSSCLNTNEIYGFRMPFTIPSGSGHVAVSESRSLMLDVGGRLWRYGNQVDGYNDYANTAVVEHPGWRFAYLANAANYHDTSFSLGIDFDGKVWSWGQNFWGQLGDGTLVFRSTPVAVELPEKIVKVATGAMHCLALGESGTVYAWGNNRGEMLGVGSAVESSPLPMVVPGLPPVADIAAGERHSLALARDGSLYGWGTNDFGQLTGRPGAAIATPRRLEGLSFRQANGSLTIATRLEKPSARGVADERAGGGMGIVTPAPGAYLARPAAVVTLEALDGERYLFDHWEGPVVDAASRKTYVTAGATTTVTAVYRLRSDLPVRLSLSVNTELGGGTQPLPGTYEYARGTAVAFSASPKPGWSFGGWTINGLANPASRVERILDGDHEVVANYAQIAFVTRPIAWLNGLHLNRLGELVNSTGGLLASVPQAGSARYSAAVQSGTTILLLARDGTLWRQSGNALTPAALTPVPGEAEGIPQFAYARAIAACKNVNFFVATRADGGIWYWGRRPGDAVDTARPTRLDGFNGNDFPAIVSGGNAIYFLHHSGSVHSWGTDQTGTGNVHATPTPIPGLAGIVAIAAGADYALALKTGGTVWGWGSNADANLGQNPATLAHSAPPVQVPGLADIAKIFAGCYAVDRQGRVWVWGRSFGYSLGLGLDYREATVFPPMIGAGLPANIVAVYGINGGTLLLTDNGEMWCWGFNSPYLNKTYPSPAIPGKLIASSVSPNFNREHRRLAVACEPAYAYANVISHRPGLYTTMDGDRITLWGNGTLLYECAAWLVDGVAVAGSHVDIVMDRDRSVAPVYALIPANRRVAPTLALADCLALLGEDQSASIPVNLSQGQYTTLEGFQFAVRIPHPLPEPTLRLPEALAAVVELYTGKRKIANPDGTEDILLQVMIKGLDTPFAEPEMTLLHLDFWLGNVPAGIYPLEMDNGTRTAPLAAITSGENGQFSVATGAVGSVLTVVDASAATLALYVTPNPTAAACLTPAAFAALPSWNALRNDRPVYAEIWASCDDRSLLDGFHTTLAATANVQFQEIHHFATAAGSRTGTLAPQEIGGLGGQLDDLEIDLLNAFNPTPYKSGNWLCLARIRLQATDANPCTLALNEADTNLDVFSPPATAPAPPTTLAIVGSPHTVNAQANAPPTLNLPVEFPVPAGLGFMKLTFEIDDPNPQDVADLTLNLLSQPAHGRVAIDPESPTGLLFYPPEDGFVGTVQFDIAVGDGTAVSAPQTVTVEILHETNRQFATGWSAFAVPGQLAEAGLGQFAANLGQRASSIWIEPVGWIWNAQTQTFATTAALRPSQPCWLFVHLDGAATFHSRRTEHSQTYHPGWNAVYVAETMAPTPEMLACWEVAEQRYIGPVSELQADRIYWILWQP